MRKMTAKQAFRYIARAIEREKPGAGLWRSTSTVVIGAEDGALSFNGGGCSIGLCGAITALYERGRISKVTARRMQGAIVDFRYEFKADIFAWPPTHRGREKRVIFAMLLAELM